MVLFGNIYVFLAERLAKKEARISYRTELKHLHNLSYVHFETCVADSFKEKY